eukprot:TRINITY_DN94100_c0_g1_i1.p1 TRINITY_DN94100_c0_g1~~TRINITY_DN94100_c0_g1_i1.p1  ORF type:complete len:416 (-),score=11.16 TRINITY_DN94100_c0_g1_i1:224-1471(-)
MSFLRVRCARRLLSEPVPATSPRLPHVYDVGGQGTWRKVGAHDILRSEGLQQDIGSIYTLTKTESRTLHPEGYAGRIPKHFPVTGASFMYRQLSFLLDKYLSKFAQWDSKYDIVQELRNGTPGFLINGPKGSGKSVLINQAVHFGRSRKILTLYIPVQRWTHGRLWIEPSLCLPGYYDCPKPTAEFLAATLRANQKILQTMPVQSSVVIPVLQDEKTPENLAELLAWGIKEYDRYGIGLKLFLDELRLNQDVPILFALDGWNFQLHRTEYYFDKPSMTRGWSGLNAVPAWRLMLFRGLYQILDDCRENSTGWGETKKHNKTFIVANDAGYQPFVNTPAFRTEDSIFYILDCPEYTDEELRTMITFYVDSLPLAKSLEKGTMPNLHRLAYKIGFMTGNRPSDTYKNLLQTTGWQYF